MTKTYIANNNLLIPNAPGTKPSAVRVAKGGWFELDGSEPINVDMLLANNTIREPGPGEKPPRTQPKYKKAKRSKV